MLLISEHNFTKKPSLPVCCVCVPDKFTGPMFGFLGLEYNIYIYMCVCLFLYWNNWKCIRYLSNFSRPNVYTKISKLFSCPKSPREMTQGFPGVPGWGPRSLAQQMSKATRALSVIPMVLQPHHEESRPTTQEVACQTAKVLSQRISSAYDFVGNGAKSWVAWCTILFCNS